MLVSSLTLRARVFFFFLKTFQKILLILLHWLHPKTTGRGFKLKKRKKNNKWCSKNVYERLSQLKS